ncbi:hypothetical protein [Virgibacillus sp. YIM 98842]|uniref:hypothetical protein n=1 Tax=Virgibacillus sp. YIM 98842 TaxID=2663533 RepID=UPI0013D9C5C8|nr:hypothetical protein [Virgibacillus sp. YIM 98842]
MRQPKAEENALFVDSRGDSLTKGEENCSLTHGGNDSAKAEENRSFANSSRQ